MPKASPKASRPKARPHRNHAVKPPMALAALAASGRRITPKPTKEEWERYFEFYNFAPVALMWLDRNGVIEEINHAGCAILCATQAQSLGRPLILFVEAKDRRAFLEHMRRSRSQDAPIETELSV